MVISNLFFIILMLVLSLIMIIVIIFQSEIRSAVFTMNSKLGSNVLLQHTKKPTEEQISIEELQKALHNMSTTRTGALIVIPGKQDIKEYTSTGERIDAVLSARLLENIFYKNSPLHDGAVVLSGNRINCAACILPVSSSKHIPENMGLRHRAALGITEHTDATAIVVSEQTGAIAIAHKENIKIVTPDNLTQVLSPLFLGFAGT